jgi:hypothetical protein
VWNSWSFFSPGPFHKTKSQKDSGQENRVGEEGIRSLLCWNFPHFSHHYDFLSGLNVSKVSPRFFWHISFFLVLTLTEYLRWSDPGYISDFLGVRLQSTMFSWQKKS